MAIISNFELLLNPLAPTAGPAAEIGRVVIQGYFLEISNLESRDINLIFRTRTSVKQTADSINSEFSTPVLGIANNIVVYDITQDNLPTISPYMILEGETIPGKQLGHFLPCLTLPAGQTASFAVLPNVQTLLPAPGSPPPDLVIRGYTELIQSGATSSPPASARVLVSPEHRGTFIDPDFDPTNFATQSDLDFDQLAYGLPTANGQAIQTLNTYATLGDPFQDLLTSNFGLSNNNVSFASLIGFAKKLSSGSNLAKRTASFKIDSIPAKIEYSIINGKFKIEEKGVERFINQIVRKKQIPKKTIPSTKTIVKDINAAVSGNKRADNKLKDLFEKLMA